MASTDPKTDTPLHPVREGSGFLLAVATALARLIWPHRHRQRTGGPLIDDDEKFSDMLAERAEHIAPYPAHD